MSGSFCTQKLSSSTGKIREWDETKKAFIANPTGPFEHTQTTPQEHYEEHREIKYRQPRGNFPLQTSYTAHFPPKSAQQPQKFASEEFQSLPFTSTTEYNDQFPEKFVQNQNKRDDNIKPIQGQKLPFNGLTSYAKDFVEFPVRSFGQKSAPPLNLVDVDFPSFMGDTFESTYKNHFPPHQIEARNFIGEAVARTHGPFLVDNTSYNTHYQGVPAEKNQIQTLEEAAQEPFPFEGDTEYCTQFVPKELPHNLPPLTGYRPAEGLQLSLPRRSLGVEYWYKGQNDNYYVLIPATLEAPCTGKQMFTTVHDNQQEACILVLYGDDPIASNNQVLGQFDLVGIPPAPKDVPRIEVTYRLDKDLVLTAEARDLDYDRHKKWMQRGDIIQLRKNK